MIRSFKCRHTKALWNRCPTKKFGADLQRAGYRKLLMIDAAVHLNDLRSPPRNRLEALKGDRKGQHSIRVNEQFRICFRWRNGDAYDVEIVDYH